MPTRSRQESNPQSKLRDYKAIPIADLTPYDRNSRTHSPAQVDQIARSIREFGWTNPVLVDEKNRVIAGHGRMLAAAKLGLSDVPCIVIPGLTDKQRRALVIADNKLAENAGWDHKMLKAELDHLISEGIDLSLIGFTDEDFIKVNELASPEIGSIDEVPEELPGALQLKDDMVFPSKQPWDIPEIRDDLLWTPPKGCTIKSWAGPDASTDDGSSIYWWQFRSDSLRGVNLKRVLVGFYVDDYRFDCMFDEAAIYGAKLLNMGVHGAIAPNYSIWADSPRAVHLWATYRARWVGRYLQEIGIRVVPDVNWCDMESLDYTLLGLPKKAPMLSVQLQTLKSDYELGQAASCLREIDQRLTPSTWLIYAGGKTDKVLEAARLKANIIVVPSRNHARQGRLSGARQ